MTTNLKTVPILTHFSASEKVERNIRNFLFTLHVGEKVILENSKQGITAVATVDSLDISRSNAVFVLEK